MPVRLSLQGNVPEWMTIGKIVLIQAERGSEGQSGQQLSPYCLPTLDVEAFDVNHGIEVIPLPSAEEWTECR